MDTIAALATPSGRSAIGVVRMSGPDALPIARVLISESEFSPERARPVLKRIKDPLTGKPVDEVLLTYFKAPHSFTGEDVVEISSHGSPVVLRCIIDLILKLGTRLAGPGEFSLRALRNGKMNLSQAEAIRDLINSQTEAAANQAVRQMEGEVSNHLRPVKDKLLRVIVLLESALEFVEDDLPPIQLREIREELLDVLAQVTALAATFQSGHLLREGIKVTIVGRPNVGKSSIFNRLLGVDRTIVTDVPGTTRDTINEQIGINGIPILLTDTAGLRPSLDPIEMMGVERTKRAMAEADLLLLVVDGAEELSAEDFDLIEETEQRKRLVALNKGDLPTFEDRLSGSISGAVKVVGIAAKTGVGFEELRQAILEPFGAPEAAGSELLITDARHYDLLSRAETELESTLRLLSQQASEEFILAHIYNALRFVGEITGETTNEEILTEIFSTFCIGK